MRVNTLYLTKQRPWDGVYSLSWIEDLLNELGVKEDMLLQFLFDLHLHHFVDRQGSDLIAKKFLWDKLLEEAAESVTGSNDSILIDGSSLNEAITVAIVNSMLTALLEDKTTGISLFLKSVRLIDERLGPKVAMLKLARQMARYNKELVFGTLDAILSMPYKSAFSTMEILPGFWVGSRLNENETLSAFARLFEHFVEVDLLDPKMEYGFIEKRYLDVQSNENN